MWVGIFGSFVCAAVRGCAVVIVVAALALIAAACAESPLVSCGDGVCPAGFICRDNGPELQCVTCGNGVIDRGEECDCGDGVLGAGGDPVCNNRLNSPTGGLCTAECTLHCGNGVVNEEELCDGSEIGVSCVDLNFDRGTVACSDSCTPLSSSCGYIGWEVETIEIENIFDVWGSGPEDIYVVRELFTEGESQILRFDGYEWLSVDIPSIEETLFSVWGSGPNDVFAVGAGGVVLQYDGTSWAATKVEDSACAPVTFLEVWGSGPDDPVWAVSREGRIWRYNRDSSGWQVSYRARCGPQPGCVCPASDSDGNPICRCQALEGIWGSGPDNIVVVGNQNILHYDGTEWRQSPRGALPIAESELYLIDVWGSGPNRAFAVGGEGIILRWDGDIWSAMNLCLEQDELAPCAEYRMRGLWGESGENVFAVGDDGQILHYDGNPRGIWTLMRSGFDLQLQSIWGSNPGDIVAVGYNGTIARYQGQSWSAYQTPDYQSFGRVWASSATNVYALLSGPNVTGEILRFDGARGSRIDTGVGVGLRGIYGSGSGEIYVVGQSQPDGRMTLSRGTPGSGFALLDVDPAVPARGLTDVWVSDDGHVFAVGVANREANETTMILHCDNLGNPCQRQQLVTTAVHSNLTALWGCSAQNVVAVGTDGRIAHYDGSIWTTKDYPDLADLQDVWSSSCDDFVAVGDDGLILHYDHRADTWERKPSGTDQVLRAIWGTGPGDIYAAGFAGVILHYDGERWSPVQSDTNQRFFGVWGGGNTTGSASSFFFAGESGTFQRLVRSPH